jgi:hypothetical protein
MFSSSSRDRRLNNPDGSWNVYCMVCQEFISKTFERTNRATCELCRRVQDGEALTDEAIKAYQLGKLDRANVTLLDLSDQVPAQAKKFSLRSMTGDFLRAFKSVKAEPPTEQTVPSMKVSKTKRRGRLFENVEIGSMLEVDEKLKASKEKV